MINEKATPGFLDTAYDHTSVEETYSMYERWAASYDEELQASGYQQPARCAAALTMLMPAPGGKILDVGCGTGLSGIALYDKGYRDIDGCDFSPAMLGKAKATGIYDRLMEVDLNRPPLNIADQTYDALTIVGVFSMQHVKPEVLDNLLRVLKPGGPIVIGLNDKFYRIGLLTAKLDALSVLGRISQLGHEHGQHIPEINLTGWVISARKTA